jgi:uncharacterized RmlC-like cupin family protein
MTKPEVVRKEALASTPQTPGLIRRQAFASEGVWAGEATTEPGQVSGWHHHGDHSTYLYVISGRARLESGFQGHDVVDAGPGDFVKIPSHTIHRESNPGKEVQRLVVFRLGSGPVVVNVDGPEKG